jgi:rubrerythrin
MMKADEQVAMTNRRSFLARAGGMTLGTGAAGLFAGLGPMQSVAQTQDDIGVIQTALALEHEGIAAYEIAGKSGLLSAGTLKVASVFMGHHQAHRDALAKLVMQAGGKPVERKSDAAYTQELKLGSLKSENDVIALATRLEYGAAGAYITQIAALKDSKLARLFAQISADEAIHWTTLTAAAGKSAPTAAFVFG